MSKLFKRSTYVVLALVTALASISLLFQGRAEAAFNKHLLITDSLFSNASTMSAGQIDAFLNTFPSSCISTNNKFSAIEPTGYNPTDGFLYGSRVSAGRIIYAAAQAYGLNPKVLLATLQKEQSLVSGTAGCSKSRYIGAMGYGCPDGGTTYSYSSGNFYYINGVKVTTSGVTCVNDKKKAGFTQQVIRGTWLLKFGQHRSRGNVNWAVIKGNWDNSDDPGMCYGGPMTAGTFKRCKDGSAVTYEGKSTIDGTSVTMGSGATAALYWYTPHLHGNQSFVNIYESWFGSTLGLADVAHPDGTLIKLPTSLAVYLVRGGQLWSFPNPQVLYSHGYKLSQVKPGTDPDLDLTVAGSLNYREGALVKGSSATIYVIDSQSGSPVKRAFSSWEVFKGLGYGISKVLTVPDSSLPATTGTAISSASAAHPDGTLVRASNSPSVYLIQGGVRLSIPSPTVLASHGYTWSDVKVANAADNALSTGSALQYREGTLLQGSTPTIYIVDDQGGSIVKRAFANWSVFKGLRYSTTEVYKVSNSALPASNGTAVGP